jgi:hypothetical protein
MSEDTLREILFPAKPLSAESVERDILTPLNDLTEGLNTLRQQLSLDLLKEAVELANSAEVAQRTTAIADIRLAVLQLQDTYPTVPPLIEALQEPLATLTTHVLTILTYLERLAANVELERDVLLKLQAKL